MYLPTEGFLKERYFLKRKRIYIEVSVYFKR